MSDSTWNIMVAFPDESASFTNGFEAGIIWALVEAGQQTIERTVHAENTEVLQRIARRMGYEIEITESSVSGWSDIIMTKVRPATHLSAVT